MRSVYIVCDVSTPSSLLFLPDLFYLVPCLSSLLPPLLFLLPFPPSSPFLFFLFIHFVSSSPLLSSPLLSSPFRFPPFLIFPFPLPQDYLLVILHPMDLSTIRQNLLSGQYDCPSSFLSDIRLVFKNAKTYNRRGSAVRLLSGIHL